jgi:hypothetical protein
MLSQARVNHQHDSIAATSCHHLPINLRSSSGLSGQTFSASGEPKDPMSVPRLSIDVNELRKADRYKKNEGTIENRPAGIGYGLRGMRKGGWTGYGVYWGKIESDTNNATVESRSEMGQSA